MNSFKCERKPDSLLAVGVVGAIVAAAYVLLILFRHGFDPSIMLALGEDAPSQTAYAERMLGRDVVVREFLGHDGKFFFIQANDPWILDPMEHAAFLDRPLYRSQRMLYPMLAGGFGSFTASVIVYSMVGINIVAVGIGSATTARLAQATGASRWLGLAFCFNPGVLGELDIGGGGVVALSLGMAGLLALQRRAFGWAFVGMGGSVLARETMVLFVVGAAFGYWLATRQISLKLALIPTFAALAWRTYASFQLGPVGNPGASADAVAYNLSSYPLEGLALSFRTWVEDPGRFTWTFCLILLMLMFGRRALKSRNAIGWSGVPILFLAAMLSENVWREPYDIARAVAPIFTIYAVLLFASGPRSSGKHMFD